MSHSPHTCGEPAHDHGPRAGATSRRDLIAGAGSLSLTAGVGADAADRHAVIDVHHHFFPPSYMTSRLMRDHRWETDDSRDWTPEVALAHMERRGVTKAIVSLTAPGVWRGSANDALELAKLCNDHAAAMASARPDRFGFFAALPLPFVEGSLREAARCLDELGASGIGLVTNYDGRYLGDPGFRPVFEELNRRKVAIHVHPQRMDCCMNLIPGLPGGYLEFPFDTTRTIASLLYSGAFADFPDINFIWSHGGGAIPMLSDRLALWGKARPDLLQRVAPQGVQHELTRQYYDIVGITRGAPLAALRAFAPAERLVFGTDTPFVDEPQLADLRGAEIPAGDLQKILAGNARRILKHA